MESLTVTGSITGMMVAFIKEILNTESGTAMEHGRIKNSLIKALIEWTRNKDSEYTLG
jgi:hypothetical protein